MICAASSKSRTFTESPASAHSDALFESLTRERGSPLPPVAGLALVAVEDGEIVYEGYFGRRYIDPEDPDKDLPVTRQTRFRMASMSKPITCIGAMRLVDSGVLDLRRDISDYLGFRLRHPLYPEIPITAEMLLSHTSSLRDMESYTIPFGGKLSEMFTEGGAYFDDGAHFANPLPGRALSVTAPGRYFEYCNLNFGVLATIMEALSGERFDLYMRDHVLEPLGIDAGYNVNLLGGAAFSDLGTLYRKAPGEAGPWRSDGVWIPQVDDYRGLRPALALRFNSDPDGGIPDLSRYEIGSNGTMFSPQGGLRISPADYAKVVRVLMDGGVSEGIRILSEESTAAMMRPRWRYDAAAGNGESYLGMMRESGLALFRTTDSSDEMGCDHLIPEGGLRMWKHHGDAYGYLGAVLFDPATKRGLVYSISGTAADPLQNRGAYSSWFAWEELIQKTVFGDIFGITAGVV